MRRIGLTGGIATGKSAVARLLLSRGIPVIDADRIARDVVDPGSPAIAAIAARWPGAVDGDRLDRKALGAIVFADPKERQALEAILHPLIREEAQRRLGELESQGFARAVYEAPLLVEKELDRELDALIVVAAPPEMQLERLMARDGLDEAQARARLEAQLPQEAKLARATFIIENSGSREDLERRVEEVWQEVERRY